MPQSLSCLLVHLVFSTKDRRPLIEPGLQSQLHAYLATVARDKQCTHVRVGGVSDHVHLAVQLHPTKALSKLIEELKTSSSSWMKTQGIPGFSWQRGYGAFSVSPADEGALARYIKEQEQHHRTRSFEDEMRAFFRKYDIPFDEKYVWD